MRYPFTAKEICLSLDPAVLYDPFYEVALPGTDQTLTIRPVCVPQDLPVIHSWILAYSGATTVHAPVPQLLETYNHLLTANYSQSFLAVVNDRPLLQFDIIRADKDDLSLEHQVLPGDFSFHFLFSPFFTEQPAFYIDVLVHCLRSFAPYPEVRRLFCKSYLMDKRSNQLLQEAGFMLEKKLHERSGEVNIYRFTVHSPAGVARPS
jgi:hypothetical protein